MRRPTPPNVHMASCNLLKYLTFFAFSSSVALTSMAAFAQTVSRPDTQVPGQVEQSLQGNAQSREAAGQAASLAETDEAPVDDQAVLARPDDIGLTYRLALQRIREGRLEMAASALQRLLLVAPNLTSVRLLYGIVLFRLDDLLEAEAEFKRVQAAGAAADTARIADEYLERIALRQRAFHGEASLGLGVAYDSNRNAFPVSDEGLFQGKLQAASGARTSDVGWTALGNASMSYDPGAQGLREIFADASVLSVNQDRVHSLDTLAGVGEIGVTYHSAFGDIKPALFGETIDVGHQAYLNMGGVSLGLSRHLSADVVGFVTAKLGYEDYLNSAEFPTNTDQNGVLYDGLVGASYYVTPTVTLTGSYEAAYVDAHTAFDSYWSHLVRLDGNYVLPWRSFLLASLSGEWRGYQGPDAFVSNSVTRLDHNYDAKLTYGIPLDTIVPFESAKSVLKDLVVNLFVDYQYDASTVPNYDWRAWRAGGLVTKSIRF